MFSVLNLYILKRFLISFFLVIVTLSLILFVGDFVEQFRKATAKNVPLNVIFQLSALNFPNLIFFTLPITAFFSSVIAYLILIRNSEKIIIDTVGISNFKISIPVFALYLFIGYFFITIANPLISILDEKYSELEYKYIDKVDKFASITKNGIWLKQDNDQTKLSSVLYAKKISNQGKNLHDFMMLEYDHSGAFQGRLDGRSAELDNGYWIMNDIQISPKYGNSFFKDDFKYKTNIKLEDIADSLSSPSSIPIWRLIKFINLLEGLGYSAIDFKMHFYDLMFLPIYLAALSLLASSLVLNLKQNDKYSITLTYSFLLIFIIYFFSNLLDALGSTGQIHPIISKCLMPIMIVILSAAIYYFTNLNKRR
tara:strand:- start:2761 stop:3861 length:1101 start_codon:yes stop_codon:yes gene_type:complete